jgi:hypothetical protein
MIYTNNLAILSLFSPRKIIMMGSRDKKYCLNIKDAARLNAIPEKKAGNNFLPGISKDKYTPNNKKRIINKSDRSHKNSPNTLALKRTNKYIKTLALSCRTFLAIFQPVKAISVKIKAEKIRLNTKIKAVGFSILKKGAKIIHKNGEWCAQKSLKGISPREIIQVQCRCAVSS